MLYFIVLLFLIFIAVVLALSVFKIFLWLLEILLLVAAIYVVYKFIWYICQMVKLSKLMSKVVDNGIVVERKRSYFDMMFGSKGQTDFVLTSKDKKYDVSLITFISVNSRWNFEKEHDGYYFEVRRLNRIFFNNYNKAETLPGFIKEYLKEIKLYKTKLFVTPKTDCTKQVFLIYPKPRIMTYTSQGFEYLIPGSVIADHEIMYAENLIPDILS